jgi:hypothetical protein
LLSFAVCVLAATLPDAACLRLSAGQLGVSQPRGTSLNIVPWLDFPTGKTTASTQWQGAPGKPTLAVISFDGTKVAFEDANFFMMMGDHQGSLCRSTLLKLNKGVQFPANTADITSNRDGAWVRLIHGAVAGAINVKVVYAADLPRNGQPFEIVFPATEALATYRQLVESKNANARQSGILALRWVLANQNQAELVQFLVKTLKDPACGVRGASAWVAGQLRVREVLPDLKNALKQEKDATVRQTFEAVLGEVK